MNDVATEVIAALHRIAPETDPARIDRAAPLVDQLDLDSMDYLRFLASVGARYHVEIPEADVPGLATIDQIVAYLGSKAGTG
jgi:acyl carrier protein